MKEVTVQRFLYLPTCTLGYMELDGLVLWVLARPWLNTEPQTSCVPVGRYPLKLEHSPAFNRLLWELKDVPGRAEVKFHPANRVKELKGCLAPGMRLVSDPTDGAFVEASRRAVEHLHDHLGLGPDAAITIRDATP